MEMQAYRSQAYKRNRTKKHGKQNKTKKQHHEKPTERTEKGKGHCTSKGSWWKESGDRRQRKRRNSGEREE